MFFVGPMFASVASLLYTSSPAVTKRFMMRPALLLIFCTSSLLATITFEKDAAISGTVTPGSTIQLKGDFTAASNLVITLIQIHGSPTGITVGHENSADNKSVSIKLPAAMEPGTFYLNVKDDQTNVNVPGTVTVQHDAVKLISVHPATQYRGASDQFNFDLIGENFSTKAEEDEVWIDGQGNILKSSGTETECKRDPKSTTSAKAAPCLWVENAGLMHVLGYTAEPYQGPALVSVRVANGAFTEKKQLLLARRSKAEVLLWSGVATVMLFLFVAGIVRSGLKGNRAGNRSLNLIQSFILDPETNSYSLSKFQLLVFSATFIFGYLYVLLARWLVQWQLGLPDVPSQLSGLLGISAATTVASTGLTAMNGSKGAGLQHPTGADLITSGGVVIAERFQFFVWTIIACCGFAALLVSQDAATLNGFPSLPEGLLYVMGVSAAGYLGGKAVRKAGPVIQNIAVDAAGSFPVLIIQGQNLASDGSFFIDGKELPIVPESQKESGAPEKLVAFTPQDGGDSRVASELRITVLKAAQVDLTTGEHRFRIVNRDGQFADTVLTANPPTISKIVPADRDELPDGSKMLRQSKASISVLVRGKGLQVGSRVTWKAQDASDPQAVKEESDSSADALRVALVPGPPGIGLLTIVTPSGFPAVSNVTVMDSLPGPSTPAVPNQIPAPGGSVAPQQGPAASAAQQPPAELEQAADEASSTSPPGQNTGTAPPMTHTAPAPGPVGEGEPGSNAPAAGPSGENTLSTNTEPQP